MPENMDFEFVLCPRPESIDVGTVVCVDGIVGTVRQTSSRVIVVDDRIVHTQHYGVFVHRARLVYQDGIVLHITPQTTKVMCTNGQTFEVWMAEGTLMVRGVFVRTHGFAHSWLSVPTGSWLYAGGGWVRVVVEPGPAACPATIAAAAALTLFSAAQGRRPIYSWKIFEEAYVMASPLDKRRMCHALVDGASPWWEAEAEVLG